MERYNKYLVVKRDDIEQLDEYLQERLNTVLEEIHSIRFRQGKQAQSYVVVAADWPMYEDVWAMIEAFVHGTPNALEIKERCIQTQESELEQVIEENNNLRNHRNELSDELESLRQQLAAAKFARRQAETDLSDCKNTLVAAQLQITQLREALSGLLQDDGAIAFFAPMNVAKAYAALALPADTALEAMIAKAGEVMRERCMTDLNRLDYWFTDEPLRALPGVTLQDI